MRAGHELGEPVGPRPQRTLGGRGLVGRALRIFARRRERLGLDVRGQQAIAGEVVVVERQAVDVQDERLGVFLLDLEDAAVEFARNHAAARMLLHRVGEGHVLRRHRRAVAPGGAGADLHGDGHALPAVAEIDFAGEAVLEGGHVRAEQADEVPVRVVRHQRALAEREHVVAHELRAGERVQARGKRRKADRERLARLGGGRRGHREKRHARPSGPHLPPAARAAGGPLLSHSEGESSASGWRFFLSPA